MDAIIPITKYGSGLSIAVSGTIIKNTDLAKGKTPVK